MSSWIQYSTDSPLLFTRFAFWVFLIVVFGVFCLVYKKSRARAVWLFVASLFFYYKSGGYYFLLLLLSVIVNFLLGKKIGNSLVKKSKPWLVLAIIFNLVWLVYYKYTYLFVEWFSSLTGINVEVHDWLGDSIAAIFTNTHTTTDIILPVGISFFTFQAISYVVDIFRRKITPLTNLFDMGFYLTFFPQLVAGPIVRAADFVPQIKKKFHIYREEFGQGLFLILNGLIKKIVVADYISINFVDRVFDSPLSYSGFENLMAVYGYAIQIYCDFSGYTDIAIGLALWFGFRLNINFNSPYKAVSISDFWHRWHISLSTWLRDYLYIPLGGNRKGKVRTYVNLFVVMTLGGLWHGANLKFVIWGALHGLYLIVDKILSKLMRNTKDFSVFRVFLTFNVVAFTWIVFRADSLNTVSLMFEQIFTNFNLQYIGSYISAYWFTLLIIVGAFAVHWLPIKVKDWYHGRFILLPIYVQAIVTLVVVFVLVQFSSSSLQPFIYFQF